MGMRSPHRETWSGTPGQPTAPRKMASKDPSRARPSSGIMRPVWAYRSQLQSKCVGSRVKPKRRPAASSTRSPSGTTSLPIPSPGMTAIRWFTSDPAPFWWPGAPHEEVGAPGEESAGRPLVPESGQPDLTLALVDRPHPDRDLSRPLGRRGIEARRVLVERGEGADRDVPEPRL